MLGSFMGLWVDLGFWASSLGIWVEISGFGPQRFGLLLGYVTIFSVWKVSSFIDD